MRPIDADVLKDELIKYFGKQATPDGIVKSGIMQALMMINVQPTLNVVAVPRPCECDGRPARFHRWCEWSEFMTPYLLIDRDQLGEQRYIFGLVEFEDGAVDAVPPHMIRFTDGLAQKPWRPE